MLLGELQRSCNVARCEIGGRGLKPGRYHAEQIEPASPAVKLAGVD